MWTHRGRIARAWVLATLGLALSAFPGNRPAPGTELQPQDPRTETEIKAYFLINFARFVDWPADSVKPGETQLTIGILGRDPFEGALDGYIGQPVKGRRIQVRRGRTLRELEDCPVLFTSQTGEDLAHTLGALKGRPVLTFGEAEDFLKLGGMVRFVLVDRKVQMLVNHKATQAARLAVSSRLMAITTVVNP